MFWIAAAGPLSNLLLAFLAAFATAYFAKFNLDGIGREAAITLQVLDVLKTFIMLNVYLAVFNLIPLHPLDGGKVLARFLPHSVNRKLEDMQQMTSFILMALFLTGAVGLIAYPALFIANSFYHLAQWTAGL